MQVHLLLTYQGKSGTETGSEKRFLGADFHNFSFFFLSFFFKLDI